MLEQINNYINEIQNFNPINSDQLEQFRLKFLSKKGLINQLFNDFKTLSADQKKEVGAKLNNLKELAHQYYNQFNQQFLNQQTITKIEDTTADAVIYRLGTRHPINLIRQKITDIFNSIGFSISVGPEIEDDWHVFSGLNFPQDHPARDMQDTFFIEKNPDILLRTHTSSVQVRIMHPDALPLRTIMPGRVYRNEAISARSHCIFHQIEGLYIDTTVSFSDLKEVLLYFSREMFGKQTKIRLRPSYFPFTEPSAEMDITCSICKGKGCNICKYTGWLEILGCGMVHPNVLKNSSIDPNKYSGFAFGMGIERIAMLVYQTKDIRMFFENDIRFLNQFKSILIN